MMHNNNRANNRLLNNPKQLQQNYTSIHEMNAVELNLTSPSLFNITNKKYTAGQQFTLSVSNNGPQQNKQISGKIITEFGGGLSGDHPTLVEIQNKQYVLKIFQIPKNETEKTRQTDEIMKHKNFMELFKDEYLPCPKIYCYGTLTINEQTHNYFIMEYTEGIELHTLILNACQNQPNNSYKDLNMINIIMELFYVICKMILSNITHCDFHTKNIIISKNRNGISLPFNKLLGAKTYSSSHVYHIKVLDFGLAVSGLNNNGKTKKCGKPRDISSALTEIRTACKGSLISAWSRLLRGELAKNYKGNTDILFFCNLLKALKRSKIDQLQSKWVDTLSIDEIREISIKIAESTDKQDKRQLLKEIYDMLTDSIPKKPKCTRREICIITNKTRRTIVPKNNINNTNNNTNKNKACKNYEICKSENSKQVCIETL
jgi:hypothetical protein